MATNFSLENLFAALSGISSGGTSAPYTAVSNPTGGMPNVNSGGMQSNNPGNTFQGNWQGNMTSQTQPQNGQGMGLSGMFRDIMNRAPAIHSAMQSSPGMSPMQSFFSGMSKGMRPNGTGTRY